VPSQFLIFVNFFNLILMSFYGVIDNLLGLLADTLPWFLGGAILGAALEAFLPTAWATRWLSSPRASILHATVAGALLPGCSMTTVPLAAALKARGARLGTLTAFIMISPILSPETIILTAALLGAKFTIARIVFPVVVTMLMGLALNVLEARRIGQFQLPAENSGVSDVKAGCCADDESLEGQRTFWRSFVALLHPLWLYFLIGLLAVAILQAVVPPRDVARYLHGGVGAYLLAAVAGIPLYVCEGAEVPLTYGLLRAGVGIGPAFTFMLGAVGTCIPTILMAPRIIGKTATYVYVAVWLLLAIGGGWAISLF
jgi:uncharacterized membrane protein YraQ (UPF0718 family)